MKLILVRHGEADSNIDGTPLIEKGVFEVKSVAKL